MKIDKVNNSFNTYKIELSFGELVAIVNAMEDSKLVDPIADEVRQGLQWYLNELPGPGEDKEDLKAAKDAKKEAEKGEGEPEDLALPSEKGEPGAEEQMSGEPSELDKAIEEPPTE